MQRTEIVCDKCGRVSMPSMPDYQWWLIGINENVFRCPQHITEWSLRTAGYRRVKWTLRFMKEAKEKDPLKNIGEHPFVPSSYLYTPKSEREATKTLLERARELDPMRKNIW